ncbi:MAG TPA: PIN domain-containing protein [Nitrospirae bacterium]|nr:PIN domain-containing protein [Nitrospirota bacterium]HDZ00125.1 PIN domain-containing protein [Nitrospirota bacterium]
MKIYYLDTSALVKLYHNEKGTEEVEKIFSTQNASIIISEIAVVELYSALYRLNRMKEIPGNAVEASIRSFEDDCKYRFSINSVGSDTINRAKKIIKRYGKDESIRTLDAIQLSVSLDHESAIIFVSADAVLNVIAEKEGLDTVVL